MEATCGVAFFYPLLAGGQGWGWGVVGSVESRHLVVEIQDSGSHGRDGGPEYSHHRFCLSESLNDRVGGEAGGILESVNHVLVVDVRVWSDTIGAVDARVERGAWAGGLEASPMSVLVSGSQVVSVAAEAAGTTVSLEEVEAGAEVGSTEGPERGRAGGGGSLGGLVMSHPCWKGWLLRGMRNKGTGRGTIKSFVPGTI